MEKKKKEKGERKREELKKSEEKKIHETLRRKKHKFDVKVKLSLI